MKVIVVGHTAEGKSTILGILKRVLQNGQHRGYYEVGPIQHEVQAGAVGVEAASRVEVMDVQRVKPL